MQQPYLNTTVFSSLLFHINILILTRVIREMTKMQLRGGKQIQQIRYELLSKLRLKERQFVSNIRSKYYQIPTFDIW